MENRTYLVTEAEKLTGEKAHVLRYWEDELGMEIHRNSLGHRCYTAQDIQIFLGIRELKKKGLHLKAIRELMPKLVQATAEIKAFPAEAAETAKEKPDPAIPGKADEVPEVVVDLLPEREAEQLADTVMRQEEEERQTEFYRVLGRLLDQLRLAARESSQMAMAANTMVSTPSTMSVGSITMRQCIIAPLQMPIRKVGTASSSRASAAAAILRPMRICGATNKATTPNTRMTTPMPVAACCE